MGDEAAVPNVSTYEYHMVNAENAQNTSRERRGVKRQMFSDIRMISRIDWITVSVLCFVNLINYMDRFTIAGMYSLDFNMLMIMVMSCPKLVKICKVRVQCCRNANGNKK